MRFKPVSCLNDRKNERVNAFGLVHPMPRCYLCSKLIPVEQRSLRRRVRIGEIEKKKYGSERARFVQSQYGMRVVCKACAAFQDHRARQRELLDLHLFLTGVVVIGVLSLAFWIL